MLYNHQSHGQWYGSLACDKIYITVLTQITTELVNQELCIMWEGIHTNLRKLIFRLGLKMTIWSVEM